MRLRVWEESASHPLPLPEGVPQVLKYTGTFEMPARFGHFHGVENSSFSKSSLDDFKHVKTSLDTS